MNPYNQLEDSEKQTASNKNATHRLFGLLRARVVRMADGEAAPLTGSVEVDETYFGQRRVRGCRGLGLGRKVESFWTYAKLRLARLRGVRWEHFYDHLKETEWRFNHRRDNLFNLLIIKPLI